MVMNYLSAIEDPTVDFILLKFGDIKHFQLTSERSRELLDMLDENEVRFWDFEGEVSEQQREEQENRRKEVLCEIIDQCDNIYSWWGVDYPRMSKEEAKKYIMEYGKGQS